MLDGDPTIVLCSGRYVEIDENGDPIAEQPYRLDLTSSRPHVRLGELMCTSRGHPIMFGVIRAGTLRNTRLLANYHGSDRAMLAELTLHGRFVELPDVLWSSRDHPGRSNYVRATSRGWDPPRPDDATAPRELRPPCPGAGHGAGQSDGAGQVRGHARVVPCAANPRAGARPRPRASRRRAGSGPPADPLRAGLVRPGPAWRGSGTGPRSLRGACRRPVPPGAAAVVSSRTPMSSG